MTRDFVGFVVKINILKTFAVIHLACLGNNCDDNFGSIQKQLCDEETLLNNLADGTGKLLLNLSLIPKQ